MQTLNKGDLVRLLAHNDYYGAYGIVVCADQGGWVNVGINGWNSAADIIAEGINWDWFLNARAAVRRDVLPFELREISLSIGRFDVLAGKRHV